MPKERSVNPVQAAHKADKARALKKSKNNLQSQRNERLAKRNPERIQRQIDDLKAIAETQQLKPRDKQTLEGLEKELKAVSKARELLGDKAPAFAKRRDGGEGRGEGRGGGNLGKRRRDEDSETDEEVRNIPMPRDTPPPIPRKHHPNQQQKEAPKPLAPAQTTYSSAPVLRNFTEESKRFVPSAVAQNLARGKSHTGRLLEPEELEKLEKAGYRATAKAAEEAEKEVEHEMMAEQDMGAFKREGFRDARMAVEEAEKEAEYDLMSKGHIDDQDVERELRHVEMEEVPDEDL